MSELHATLKQAFILGFLLIAAAVGSTAALAQGGSSTASLTVPPGTVAAWAGGSPPEGWLMADGSPVSRVAYVLLFNAIGETYGEGDGNTTFNLPDLRGRTVVGKGTNAQIDALNDSDGLAVGSRKPGHAHQIPNHSHSGTASVSGTTGTAGAHAHGPSGSSYFVIAPGGSGYGLAFGPYIGYGATLSTQTSTDGSHTHSFSGSGSASVGSGNDPASVNVQSGSGEGAFLTLNYIIKY